MTIKAYAALQASGKLEAFEYDPGKLVDDEVEVQIEHCGICHSDLSMLNDDWGRTQFPLVPGHEVTGVIIQCGASVQHLKPGQRVGIGWISRSCLTCEYCMGGHQNRCQSVPQGSATIIDRHGGFADKIRCQAAWAIPLPDGLSSKTAGPLFCGGITVFNPFITHNIRPTQRVGIVGIGGLGHMALMFANRWGCEVTALSTSDDKRSEALDLGAHYFINTQTPGALEQAANHFDFLLVTVNVALDWDAHINTLRPGGRLHIVGAIPEIKAAWFPVLGGDKQISGSPLGSQATVMDMLEFSARHDIQPLTEHYPMSKVNEAIDKLKNASPRYRLVLDNDF